LTRKNNDYEYYLHLQIILLTLARLIYKRHNTKNKNSSPRKATAITYLNKGDKHSYYPNLILVLVAVILTFEEYLLIIKALGAYKT
jgi:hypothetical protein